MTRFLRCAIMKESRRQGVIMTEKECLMLALAGKLDKEECVEILDLIDQKLDLSKRINKCVKELKNAVEIN